jgi:hypothetical protein
VRTDGRERRGRQLVAFENKPPRLRADWRYATGSLLTRIAAAATTVFAMALAQVQAQPAAGPGSGGGNIKFYIGLSQGGLNDDNEDDLRAFAVVQDHVNSIKRQLSIDARTGDWTFWNSGDWKKLRGLPITHYIVAQPKKTKTPSEIEKKTPSEIEVEWHVGKFPANDFSASREPEYVGILKERTIITIAGSDAAPNVAEQEGNTRWPFNDWGESAEQIVRKLYKIFPETQKKYGFFVECFRNNVLDWRDVHHRMMVSLSDALEKGAGVGLFAVWKADSPEAASTMCNESKYRDWDSYKDAYLYVGGSIWLYGSQNWVQPRITIRNRLSDDREKFAITQKSGARVDEQPELDQFCMKARDLSFKDVDTLKTYIQSQGFHFRQPIDLGDWKC